MKQLLILILGFIPASATHAAVIYSGLQNIPIATTFDGIYLDIDNASTSTSTILGWDINPFFGGYALGNSASFQPVRASTSNMAAILNLAPGTPIDSLLDYATGEAGSSTHIGGGANQFTAGSQGYLGFRFNTNSNAGPYYGWMRVTFTVNTSGATIHDWAYDNTGGTILAGLLAVPEPSRALLLMFAATSLTLPRRRTSFSCAA